MTIAAAPAAQSPSASLASGIARIDAMADRAFGGWKVPGLVYGVVHEGDLVHVRGLGTLRLGEAATPDGRSVFRIASMTKSFTAATVVLLRDEGRLRLDDPIEEHVPELGSLRYPTSDSPRITIRHLLTMTAGFPTDDPWGDRQQGLDLDEFSRLLADGLSFAWAPGTRFEYSNTGYGILGRLITNLAGREYREVVRERLLAPLGMNATGYLQEEADPARLAHGYVWRDDGFVEEPIDGYGALAPMGGIFTTVADLSRWVAGFLDAFPPRDDPDDRHPLSRASRREMQQPMVPELVRLSHTSADSMPEVEGLHYGFGLFQADDVRYGRTIGHSGGYPGFGSHMRWHPASGLGIIAFANHRYGPAAPLARDMMNELLRLEAAPLRRTRPNAATLAAREAVERLIEGWDDDLAAATFAMNIELDEPLEARKAAIERLKDRHGPLRRDEDTPDESQTAYHLIWWLRGDRGRVRVELLLSPELPPRVQTLAITSVPEPPNILRAAAERIVAALENPESGPVAIDWPRDVVVTRGVDLGQVVRAMRATEARFAPLTLGPSVEGDGEKKATFRLDGPRGKVDLVLTLDVEAACVSSVGLVPVKLAPPALD
jgi:CubicO group peptidase (beta-lactamase class C family)